MVTKFLTDNSNNLSRYSTRDYVSLREFRMRHLRLTLRYAKIIPVFAHNGGSRLTAGIPIVGPVLRCGWSSYPLQTKETARKILVQSDGRNLWV